MISPILAPFALQNFSVSTNNISQQLSLSWEIPSVTNGQIKLYRYCYTKVSGGNEMCNNTADNSTKLVNITKLG